MHCGTGPVTGLQLFYLKEQSVDPPQVGIVKVGDFDDSLSVSLKVVVAQVRRCLGIERYGDRVEQEAVGVLRIPVESDWTTPRLPQGRPEASERSARLDAQGNGVQAGE